MGISWFPHCMATYTEWRQILYGEYQNANEYTEWRHTLYGDRYDLATSDTLFSPWCYAFLGTFAKVNK